MQTFLPYADFAASARCLDRQRLGKLQALRDHLKEDRERSAAVLALAELEKSMIEHRAYLYDLKKKIAFLEREGARASRGSPAEWSVSTSLPDFYVERHVYVDGMKSLEEEHSALLLKAGHKFPLSS